MGERKRVSECVCVCLFVCVREREREREIDRIKHNLLILMITLPQKKVV